MKRRFHAREVTACLCVVGELIEVVLDIMDGQGRDISEQVRHCYALRYRFRFGCPSTVPKRWLAFSRPFLACTFAEFFA